MSTTIAEIAFAQPKKISESPVKPHLSGKLREGVTKRVRVGFEFTPVPEFIEREIESPALERLLRILMRYARRGISDPSVRVLAKAMKRCDRMVRRYIKALVGLGKLIVQERRITRDRNATNVYILPDLQRGVGDKNVTEKLRADVKTTTPTPAAPASKSDMQLLHEARLKHDQESSRWRREHYERKGWFIKAMVESRLEKAWNRTRAACVGMFTGEVVPMTAEEVAEYEREMAVLDAKRAARLGARA